MTRPFFITGLPMSRTSWLANLFSSGSVFCYHDLLGTVSGMKEFFAAMGQTAPVTGDADSGLLACYSQVKAQYPEAPWLLVTREFEAAWDSLCAFVAAGPWQDKLACTWELKREMEARWETARLEIIQNPRCFEVTFESLDRLEQLECIWKHCAPGQRFDRRRAMLLQGLRVQPMQAKTPARPRLSLIHELSATAEAT